MPNEPYAYAWYLTEIHSSDYIDDNSNGITDDGDKGNWIRLEYDDPEQLQNVTFRFPTFGQELYYISSSYYYDPSFTYRSQESITSFSYLKNITTPLYVAEFVTADDREDAHSTNWTTDVPIVHPLRLDYITLRERDSSEILKVVDFGYASGDERLAGKKLTLKNVTIYGKSGTSFERGVDPHLPPIEFSYDYNPEYNPYAYDYWGYYNGATSNNNCVSNYDSPDNYEPNASAVAAWSLTNISWESGGRTDYIYESNNYSFLQNVSVNNNYGGGVRLKAAIRDNGLGNQSIYSYAYAGGVVYYNPINHTFFNYISGAIDVGPWWSVDYQNVTEILPGFGSIEREYTTYYDYPYEGNYTDYKIGLIKSVYYRDEERNVAKIVNNTWNFGEKEGFEGSSSFVSGVVNLTSVSVQQDGLTTTMNYVYNDKNQISQITEQGSGTDRITTITYAYEFESNMADKNMLAQLDEMNIYENSVDAANLKSKSKIVYSDFCGLFCEQLYPDYVRVWNDTTNNNYFETDFVDYNDFGNLETWKDSELNTFEIRYDSNYKNAYPTSGWNDEIGSVGDPAWELGYDEFGSANLSIDSNDKKITSKSDEYGRIKNITVPDDGTVVFYDYYLAEENGGLASNNLNYLKATFKLNGNTESEVFSYFDGEEKELYGKLEEGAQDTFVKTIYDNFGLVNMTYEPYKASSYTDSVPIGTDFVTYSYENDPLARLSTVKYPGDVNRSYSYGSAGNDFKFTVIDEENKQATAYIDKLGNLINLQDPDGESLIFVHDILGNALSITNQEGQVVTNSFDSLGRLLSSDDVDSGTTILSFDKNGNLIILDDAENAAISYVYDSLDRLTKIDFPIGVDINFTYDISPPNPPAGLDNPKNGLTTIEDGSGKTHYYYDSQGRLAQINKTIDGKDYITKYTYDKSDNLISMIDLHGREINYTYNSLNQIVRVEVDGVQIANYTYTNEGLYKNKHLGSNSIDIDYTYTNKNQLDSLDVYSGAGTISQRHFEYYDSGVVKNIYNTTTASTQIAGFNYDNLYRLSNVTDFNSYYGNDFSYIYDKVGNRLSEKIGDDTYSYTYLNGTNKLQSDGVYNYSYYANANRKVTINATTGALIMNFTYSERNQLTRVDFSDGSNVQYVYDGGGRLIKKIDKNGLPIIYYAGESSASSDAHKFYIKNGSGDNVAWLGDAGNIVLKGQCFVQVTCTTNDGNSLIFKSNLNETVAFVNSTGDLCIETGDCSDQSASCSSPNDSFIVLDGSNNEVIVIDTTNGDLCLTGRLIENGNP